MRVIHNTSFIVNLNSEAQWLEFMQNSYIPSIRSLQLCADTILTKVSIDQPDGKTYSLQLVFTSQQDLDKYLLHHMSNIDSSLIKSFQGQYLCFNSILTEL